MLKKSLSVEVTSKLQTRERKEAKPKMSRRRAVQAEETMHVICLQWEKSRMFNCKKVGLERSDEERGIQSNVVRTKCNIIQLIDQRQGVRTFPCKV